MTTHHDLIRKLTRKMEEWDYQFDRLEHRIQDAPTELKAKFDDKMKEVQKYKEVIKTKINDLETASNVVVEDLNKTLEGTWSSLKTAYEDAKSIFKSDKEQ